jgi:hypothetical protein
MVDPRLTFGKYVGQPLSQVPSSYLAWMLNELRGLDHRLRDAVRRELDRRTGQRARRPGEGARAGPGPNLPANLPEILRTWYHELVLKYHPDRGGTKEAMQAVNDANDRLRKLVGLAS